MKNQHDTRQILTWSIVTLAIIGLFIGLSFLGGSAGAPNTTVSGPLAPVNEFDHIRGPSTAKATLIEYSDFQCPACGQYEPIVREVENTFPNDLRVVYRHFPLVEKHPNAMPASIASEAAHKQGKFWEYHDMLFDRQSQWSEATSTEELFSQFAVNLGLNKEQFQKDLQETATTEKITNDMTSGNNARIDGTPTFFLNGIKIQVQSLEEMKSAVQKAIDATKK